MAFKDPNDKKRYDREYAKSNQRMYGAKVRIDSGIPEAMVRATNATGLTANAYVVEALTEKLIRDGYLIAESQTSEE